MSDTANDITEEEVQVINQSEGEEADNERSDTSPENTHKPPTEEGDEATEPEPLTQSEGRPVDETEQSEESLLDSESEDEVELSLREDSAIYVVSLDDAPIYYAKTAQEARDSMWNTARRLRGQCNGTFRALSVSEIMGKPDELWVTGRFRFALISYERTLHRFKLTCVSELQVKQTNRE